MPDRLTPEQWLAKAAEAREIAATMQSSGARVTMLQIAAGYEKLARSSALMCAATEAASATES